MSFSRTILSDPINAARLRAHTGGDMIYARLPQGAEPIAYDSNRRPYLFGIEGIPAYQRITMFGTTMYRRLI